MNLGSKITALYDRASRDLFIANEKPATYSEIVDAIQPDVRALIAKTKRNYAFEALNTTRAILSPVRDSRAQLLKDRLEFFTKVITEPEMADVSTVWLEESYRLGTHAGEEKPLGYWTESDLVGVKKSRRKDAKKVADAARELGNAIDPLTNIMHANGAFILSDLVADA
jgi:hypothetical protein